MASVLRGLGRVVYLHRSFSSSSKLAPQTRSTSHKMDYDITWKDYEQQTAMFLNHKLGFDVVNCGSRGDGGVDFRGSWKLPDKTVPVVGQCKFSHYSLGPNYVRELEGVLTKEKEGTVGFVVCVSGYSRGGMEEGSRSNWPLILIHFLPYNSQEKESSHQNSVENLPLQNTHEQSDLLQPSADQNILKHDKHENQVPHDIPPTNAKERGKGKGNKRKTKRTKTSASRNRSLLDLVLKERQRLLAMEKSEEQESQHLEGSQLTYSTDPEMLIKCAKLVRFEVNDVASTMLPKLAVGSHYRWGAGHQAGQLLIWYEQSGKYEPLMYL